MSADDALVMILKGCERLRWLPESRWRRPLWPALGARAPQEVPELQGPSCEMSVRDLARVLMAQDAAARGVAYFEPAVPVFALPDVVEALARSIARRDPQSAVLQMAAEAAARW